MAVQINSNYNIYYNGNKYNSIQAIHKIGNMHGVTRVFIFCMMTILLPIILIVTPLYLKHKVFSEKHYSLSESDVITISEGISSIFCQTHTLRMNVTFNAFQVRKSPAISSTKRKHIRLRKSMSLPDDTLEYWGFYLLKGASVSLKVCSRYEGSRLLVVRGERNLRTCGLLEHNLKKIGASMDQDYKQVKVNFETVQEIKVEDFIKLGKTNDDHLENVLAGNEELEHSAKVSERDETLQEVKLDDFVKLVKTNVEHLENELVRNEEQEISTKKPEHHHLRHEKHKLHSEKDLERLEKYLDLNTTNITDVRDGIQSNYVNSNELKLNTTHIHHLNINNNSDERNIAKITNSTLPPTENNKPVESTTSEKDNVETVVKQNLSIEENSLDPAINQDDEVTERVIKKRHPRDVDMQLDGHIEHGGNAINYTFFNSDESVSSFEMGLLTCYAGSILLTQDFDPSQLCTDVDYLEHGDHMETIHEVVSDGYYYYIFYSDNDFISNDIHAIFDIYKPTFQFGNVSNDKECLNRSECSFPVSFWNEETVIVEVPTTDGIEVHEHDAAALVSTCHPRMAVYVVFPITVLFIILGCAFM